LGFVGIADNERDAREGRKFFRGALSVTAGDKDFGGRILRVNFANGIAGLCIGGGSDGAGVDDDELGVLRRSRRGAAAIKELAFDGGAVGLGGATAELFDVEGRHCGKENLAQRARRAQRTERRFERYRSHLVSAARSKQAYAVTAVSSHRTPKWRWAWRKMGEADTMRGTYEPA